MRETKDVIICLTQGDTCCWICQRCQPFEFMVNRHECDDCGDGRWPFDNKTGCFELKSKVKYLRLSVKTLRILPVSLVCITSWILNALLNTNPRFFTNVNNRLKYVHLRELTKSFICRFASLSSTRQVISLRPTATEERLMTSRSP